MERKEYNGWTNYETWAVALWIDNDGGADRWIERAGEILDQPWEPFYPSQDHARSCAHQLGAEIKDEHEEGDPTANSESVYEDLMRAALSEVNWDEIAGHYVDAARTSAEAGK